MLDLTYKNSRLRFVIVDNVTTEGGNADALARAVERWDTENDPTEYAEWPSFDSAEAGTSFTATFDACELYDFEGIVNWRCHIDLSSALDWSHPWKDHAAMAAETIYREHRNAEDPRWTLPHITADALQFVKTYAADAYEFTPMDADRLLGWFLYEAMPAEAEERDPMNELLGEAMRDAQPISTGIAQLDNALGGGLHKGFSILAGDPSSGKTALAAQLALFAANQQEGITIYDMSDMGGAKSALARLVTCAAAVCGVDGCKLGLFDQWDDHERKAGIWAFRHIAEDRIMLCELKDVREVISTLEFQHRTRGGVALAVLDFAQAMTYDGRSLAFDPEAASLAVRELREWAHDHDAAVLLLSAYSKSAAEAHARGAAPTMTDVLGSVELGYSAEHVLALTNPNEGSGTVTVRDLKTRHGGGSCTLDLDADHGRFI